MPSDLWEKRASTFECKFSEFCQYTMYTVVKFLFVYLSVYLSGCLFIRLFYTYYHITAMLLVK